MPKTVVEKVQRCFEALAEIIFIDRKVSFWLAVRVGKITLSNYNKINFNPE